MRRTMIPTIKHMRIFMSFHHICFRTLLAPRRNPWADTARLSVLSCSESNRSPRCETLLIFSRITPTVSSICCAASYVSPLLNNFSGVQRERRLRGQRACKVVDPTTNLGDMLSVSLAEVVLACAFGVHDKHPTCDVSGSRISHHQIACHLLADDLDIGVHVPLATQPSSGYQQEAALRPAHRRGCRDRRAALGRPWL